MADYNRSWLDVDPARMMLAIGRATCDGGIISFMLGGYGLYYKFVVRVGDRNSVYTGETVSAIERKLDEYIN